MRQDEWFEKMSQTVDDMHAQSHEVEVDHDSARLLVASFQAMVDVLQHMTNSTSWGNQRMLAFDKHGFSNELDEKVLWRLDR